MKLLEYLFQLPRGGKSQFDKNVPYIHRDKPLVRIESNSTEYNGDYKIISIEHNGDLYGFNWHSKLVGICGKFDKV